MVNNVTLGNTYCESLDELYHVSRSAVDCGISFEKCQAVTCVVL